MSEPLRTVHWRAGDVLLWSVGLSLGTLWLVVSWWATSATAELSAQYTWAASSVAGLIAIGAANCLWLLSGRRALGIRRGRLFAVLRADHPRAATDPRGPWPDDEAGRPVAAREMTRYHRSDCQLVVGKKVARGSVAAHHRGGRTPCGMCEP